VKDLWTSLQSKAALALACIDVHAQNWYSNVIYWFWFYFVGDDMFRKWKEIIIYYYHYLSCCFEYIYISVCLFGCDYILTLPNREAFPPLLASLESPQQNGVNIVVFLIFGLTKQKLLGLECI